MDNMDEFKQIFFTECAELLADMEERLMKLEEGSQDLDQLNAIFRCAHSIKGGAGAFGLDAIMHFTHALEALLDAMREGKLLPTRESIDALLQSADMVTKMLAAEQEGTKIDESFAANMITKVQSFLQGAGGAPVALPKAAAAVAAPVVAASGEPVVIGHDIQFKPQAGLFLSGNDPLLILRELATLGEASVTPHIEAVPALTDYVATDCYMSWDIRLTGDAKEEVIREVFEFVTDIAEIRITPVVEAVTAAVVAAAPVETQAEVAAPAAQSKKQAADAAPAAKAAATSSIRVDLDKIDRLVNMVGELVITEAMLKAQVRDLPAEQFIGLLRGIDELSHHTRELQEAVMAVRMQPVKSVFSRMPRIVRDTAAQLGKEINIILSGENTEVDKTVIESLSDPLTHMIRNSVDHGIETPDQRVWHDKPQAGTIHLSAYHQSGRIIIEIADDGAGINRDRVLGKAKEKGLVAADANLSDEEIDHLIFLPGFSTAEKVTNVSGRGVGMDVVKRNIEGLGGNVRVTNRPGHGSTFTVSLPLTLAILDGMIVRVGVENYIVPITSIIETLRPKKEEVHRVEGRSDVINVRGEFLPLVYLHRLFGVANAVDDPSSALIVLVESGTQKMGLVVNELIGQQQVVIKSLEANADPVKGISGATILGDGKVSLILEINELKHLIGNNKPTKKHAVEKAA